MTGPFKMKGFSGFGNSPVKDVKTDVEGAGNKKIADDHKKKHDDNPSWGEDHDGPLSDESPVKDDPHTTTDDHPAHEELTDEEKKRAIQRGKLANWNKANPDASQEEMNAQQKKIWAEGDDNNDE